MSYGGEGKDVCNMREETDVCDMGGEEEIYAICRGKGYTL